MLKRFSAPEEAPALALEGIEGLAFDHFAVAVRRIRDVLPLYVGLLRGRFIGGGDNPNFDRADWKELFIHPRETSGLLIQLAQVGPGFEAALCGTSLEAVLAGRGVSGNGIASA